MKVTQLIGLSPLVIFGIYCLYLACLEMRGLYGVRKARRGKRV